MLYYLYDASGSIQGFIYNNDYYYFQKNLQGDVIRILDQTGNIVTEYTYDAWGKVLTVTGTLADSVGRLNPFRYRGCYYDSETGWYYLNGRYYDPEIGRFLSARNFTGAEGGVLGYNLFLPGGGNNNPVTQTLSHGQQIYKDSSRPFSGTLTSPLDNDLAWMVKYDVPLYPQVYDLCWAFCQIMVEDYEKGIVRTQDEAIKKAEALGAAENPENPRGRGTPTNLGAEVHPQNINDLYDILVAKGPLYARYYTVNNDGHCVVVTSVDLDKGLVFTNNPWGCRGSFTYEEFLNGFPDPKTKLQMTLRHINLIQWEEMVL